MNSSLQLLESGKVFAVINDLSSWIGRGASIYVCSLKQWQIFDFVAGRIKALTVYTVKEVVRNKNH